MSRIGRIPVEITNGVNVAILAEEVKVTGPKGEMSFRIPRGIKAEIAENKVVVSPIKESEEIKPLFGLTRVMIANMIKGVTIGFEKKLELAGVGYRAQMQGENLSLSLGFSHPVVFKKTPGISFSVAENVITVSGIDKALIGNTAAKIREVRPPEPYKGKGIKYVGERIKRKAGKAAKAVGGK